MAATAYLVLRAAADRPTPPAVRWWSYYNATTGTWGDYAIATRYDHTPTDLPEAPTGAAHVTAVNAYPIDLDGHPYSHGSAARMTACCGAGTGSGSGIPKCMSCHRPQPPALAAPPRLALTGADHYGLNTVPAPIPASEAGATIAEYRSAINANLDAIERLHTDPAVAAQAMGWAHWLDDRISTIATLLADAADAA